MHKSKKAAAAAVAAAMTLSLAGCTDTSYVMTYNDNEKINAGVYIYNLYTEMSYQMTMMYYVSGVTEGYLDQEVEGKKLSEYLPEKAKQATKEYAAIITKFDELGLELTEEELKTISDNLRDQWDASKDLYEKEGISKESIRQVQKGELMRTKLFDYYYGEGGEEAAGDSDLEQYVKDNYLRYKTISIAKSTDEDETVAEQDNKDNEALRDSYLEKAEGLGFDEFDDVIDEYNAYVADLTAAAEETSGTDLTDDSTAEIDLGETDDSDEAEAVAQEETEAEADAPEDSTADTEETADEAAEDTAAEEDYNIALPQDEEAVADEVTTAEEDPYANETMLDYGNMDDDTKESDQGKLADAINALEVGKAAAYEDDNYYYIIIKGDVAERAAQYALDNHDTLLHSLKDDDFQTKLDSWIEALNIKENSDALKRYSAKQVYDLQEEYYTELNK